VKAINRNDLHNVRAKLARPRRDVAESLTTVGTFTEQPSGAPKPTHFQPGLARVLATNANFHRDYRERAWREQAIGATIQPGAVVF